MIKAELTAKLEVEVRERIEAEIRAEMPTWTWPYHRDEWIEWFGVQKSIGAMAKSLKYSYPWPSLKEHERARAESNTRGLHQRIEELLKIPGPPGLSWVSAPPKESSSDPLTWNGEELGEDWGWYAYQQAQRREKIRTQSFKNDANATRCKVPYWVPADSVDLGQPPKETRTCGNRHTHVRRSVLVSSLSVALVETRRRAWMSLEESA